MRRASKIFSGARFVARRVLPAPVRVWMRRTIEKAVDERCSRLRLREAIRASESQLKVIVGAGETAFVGWVATDYPRVDITDLNSLKRWFKIGSVQALLAEHVWEHLVPDLAQAAAGNCYRLLVPGGHLRIAVPDGLHPDPKYIDHVRPGGTGPGCEDHRVLYTYRTLVELLEVTGFEVSLLEWFDEEGQFHFREWDPNDGLVLRSTHYDERNANHPTAYTSIIADAVKPGDRRNGSKMSGKRQYADRDMSLGCRSERILDRQTFRESLNKSLALADVVL
jgi:predicted SAM-dependent methyltransferase